MKQAGRAYCFLAAGAMTLLCSQVVHAVPIDLISQTHHVWGNVEEVAYDQTDAVPISGTAQKYTDDGAWQGLVTMSSATLGTTLDRIITDADAVSEGPYTIDNRSNAEVVYDFYPLTDSLDLAFDGYAGEHYFTSGMYYRLEDVTAGTMLDSRSWEFEEYMGWVDDVLPYEAAFSVIPAHRYRLTVGSYASLGDSRTGTAHLETVIVPEPGMLGLLVVAGMIAVRRR